MMAHGNAGPKHGDAVATPHLVFIGGGQRSGTTLAQTVIANLLSSRVLPEAHVLHDIIASYKRARLESQKNLDFFDGFASIRAYYSASVDLFIDSIKRDIVEDPIVVFKDPNFSTIFDQIRDVVRLPFSRLLVVRDPRDIAASFISIGVRDKKEGRNSKYAMRNIGYICDKINKSYELCLEGSAPGFEFTLRYEDLVTGPAEAVQGIVSAFGLEGDAIESGLTSLSWLPSSKLHKPSWVSELEGGPISAASVGGYGNMLTRKEADLVQEHCSTLMSRFGYRPR